MASNWSYNSTFLNPKEDLMGVPHMECAWEASPYRCKGMRLGVQNSVPSVVNWLFILCKMDVSPTESDVVSSPLSFWPWTFPVVKKSVQSSFHNTQQIPDWVPPDGNPPLHSGSEWQAERQGAKQEASKSILRWIWGWTLKDSEGFVRGNLQ